MSLTQGNPCESTEYPYESTEPCNDGECPNPPYCHGEVADHYERPKLSFKPCYSFFDCDWQNRIPHISLDGYEFRTVTILVEVGRCESKPVGKVNKPEWWCNDHDTLFGKDGNLKRKGKKKSKKKKGDDE